MSDAVYDWPYRQPVLTLCRYMSMFVSFIRLLLVSDSRTKAPQLNLGRSVLGKELKTQFQRVLE